MADTRLNPCHCGNEHFNMIVSPHRVTIMCSYCCATYGCLPPNGRTSYTSISKAMQYLVPKAIKEWNSHHKPKEDAHG